MQRKQIKHQIGLEILAGFLLIGIGLHVSFRFKSIRSREEDVYGVKFIVLVTQVPF